MAPQVQASRVLQFGAFEVDLRTGSLRKSGARIKLQEQPFQILAMLLEKPGDMVTREELRQKLWPADTFVDFDNGLNTALHRNATKARLPFHLSCKWSARTCGSAGSSDGLVAPTLGSGAVGIHRAAGGSVGSKRRQSA